MSSFDSQPGSDDHLAKNTETSDRRVFTEVWKKMTGSSVSAILLTATRVYVGGRDKIIVYDTAIGQEIGEIASTCSYIWDISQSRDGKSLFVACVDKTARVINLFTGKEVILRGHTDVVRCIIQGEGTDVLTCSNDKTIRRWNSSTGERLKVYEGHTAYATSILYDEATKRIFSASGDTTIIVWNSGTGEKIGVLEGHGDLARSLARVNSTTIASCSYDDTIKLWDMATLTCTKTTANDRPVSSVAATPDGKYLISGSSDNKVRVWSVATGQCLHTLSQHNSFVSKVAVSPDGRFIASGGNDCIFHLHSVSPPFSFVIREGVLARNGREGSLSLFSDGVIRARDGDLVTTITSTSTCSLVSDNRIVIHSRDSVDLTAPSISSAHLWSEVICAVAVDLALHPDDRAHSADRMIRLYRFNLLQTILFCVREADFRRHVPREIVQIIAGYCS